MSDSFKFGNSEIKFNQFLSALDKTKLQENKELKKLFGIFDTDNNNQLDVQNKDGDNEAVSLFNAIKDQIDSNQDGTVDEHELSMWVEQSVPEEERTGVLSAVKEFFRNIINPEIDNDLKPFGKGQSPEMQDERMSSMEAIQTIADLLPENFLEEHPDFTARYDEETGNVYISTQEGESITYNRNFPSGPVEYSMQDKANKTITIMNYKNNIRQEIHYTTEGQSRICSTEKTEYLDENGNVTRTVIRTPSSVDGIQNISVTDADGNQTPVQFGSYDENSGSTIISKDFVSPDGTRTEYYCEESEDLRISSYRITDANGKVLMDRSQTYQKISENEYVQSINGTSYRITFNDLQIEIQNTSDGTVTNLDLTGIVGDGKEKVLAILKQMPVDRLLAMESIPIENISFTTGLTNMNNAAWHYSSRSIEVGEQVFVAPEEQSHTLFAIFMHEFGHYLDSNLDTGATDVISGNEELIAIYNEELKAFMENTTSVQQGYLTYFTNEQRGVSETVGETDLLLTTDPYNRISDRALYLQQYFPRTIAKIAELTDQRIRA